MTSYYSIVEGHLLLKSGKGVTEYTIREICNIAYFLITDKFPAPNSDDDPSIEEQLEKFEEGIGQRIKSSVKAERALREFMIMRGMDPDAKPEISEELQAKMDRDAGIIKTNADLMWGGDAWEGKEITGAKIKDGELRWMT